MTRLATQPDPMEVPASATFKHLAVTPSGIIHIKTGLLVAPSLDEGLAKHLDKNVRWTWLDSQPFGPVPEGRGRTMCRNAIRQHGEEYLCAQIS
jgi:hypothetical protein